MDSLPRSYFLGHHSAGLRKMKTMLNLIDLVIECRDYRVPLTSYNPMFEESLADRERVIVYTKRDLGNVPGRFNLQREGTIRRWHSPSQVLFSDHKSKKDLESILSFVRDYSETRSSLTGTRMMVVGMPNVGKSSLINALRYAGVGKGKVAHTGAQPGVTRKIATGVKIIERTEESEGVYLVDTPGVFVPYVPDADAMLKLALCGSVKDTIIAPVMLADYLLFQVNLHASNAYKEYCEPTNEVMEVLEAMARKTGRLGKGGVPDVEATALWMIQRWRQGHLGRFVLDNISEDALERKKLDDRATTPSLNQARKAFKEAKRAISRNMTAAVG